MNLIRIANGPFSVILDFVSDKKYFFLWISKIVGNISYMCAMEQIDKWIINLKSISLQLDVKGI